MSKNVVILFLISFFSIASSFPFQEDGLDAPTPRIGSWAQLYNDINTSNRVDLKMSAFSSFKSAFNPTLVQEKAVNPTGPIFHKEVCGHKVKQEISSFKRIIGGKEAEEGSVPWQVGIVVLPELGDDSVIPTITCGGTILTPYAFLTAAHCLQEPPHRYEAVVGRHSSDLFEEECREQKLKVLRYFNHPGFNTKTLENDISVVSIRTYYGQGIQFSKFVVPACLGHHPSFYSPQSLGTVSGWGLLEEKASLAAIPLNKVDVPIVESKNCVTSYGTYASIDDSKQFCAGESSGGRDACSGDSGGPFTFTLASFGSEQTFVIGVVSYGIGCGRAKYPGVYTRVSSYLPWIKEMTDACQADAPEKESNNYFDEKFFATTSTSTTTTTTTTTTRTTTTQTTTTTKTTTTRTTTKMTTPKPTTNNLYETNPASKDPLLKSVGPVCEGFYNWLSCEEGQDLEIQSVYFGRKDKTVCPVPPNFVRAASLVKPKNDDCAYERALEDLQRFCWGKRICYVNTNVVARYGPFFENPCEHLNPYVLVEYVCKQREPAYQQNNFQNYFNI